MMISESVKMFGCPECTYVGETYDEYREHYRKAHIPSEDRL